MPISGRGTVEVSGSFHEVDYSYEPLMEAGRKRFRGEMTAASPVALLAVFNVQDAILIEEDGQRMRITVSGFQGGNSALFVGDRL